MPKADQRANPGRKAALTRRTEGGRAEGRRHEAATGGSAQGARRRPVARVERGPAPLPPAAHQRPHGCRPRVWPLATKGTWRPVRTRLARRSPTNAGGQRCTTSVPASSSSNGGSTSPTPLLRPRPLSTRRCANWSRIRAKLKWSERGTGAGKQVHRLDPEVYKRAIDFAASAHGAQTIPGSGFPYVVHVAKVAMEVIPRPRGTLGSTGTWPWPAPSCMTRLRTPSPRDRPDVILRLHDGFGRTVVEREWIALSKDDSIQDYAERMADSLRRIPDTATRGVAREARRPDHESGTAAVGLGRERSGRGTSRRRGRSWRRWGRRAR